jgi:lipopolysaccharide export system protein LptA
MDSILKANANKLKKTLKKIEEINRKSNQKKIKLDSLRTSSKATLNKGISTEKKTNKNDSSNTSKSGMYIQVLKSDFFRRIQVDSSQTLNILVGNVLMKQEKTLFYCDSSIQDITNNTIEAFGNVHINDSDSIHTYSDYLKYYGETRIATLRNNVKLTDGKVNLTTDELEYDLNAKLGTYLRGGKVVNGKSVLTSTQGYYYTDTKDIYFQKNVLLVDPDYRMYTDTLLYNVKSEIASFLAITTIKDDKARIKTRSGFYDLKLGKAKFTNRPILIDSTQIVIADNIIYDNITGQGNADGNVFYRDSSQEITMLSGGTFFNTASKEITSYKNPVLIMKQDQDNLFLAADTLFSAYQKIPLKKQQIKDSLITIDSTVKKNFTDLIQDKDSIILIKKKDTADFEKTINESQQKITQLTDSLASLIVIDSTNKIDTFIRKVNSDTKLYIPSVKKDNLNKVSATVDTLQKQSSTSSGLKKDTTQVEQPTDSVRYFKAYHNVKMYSDSIQGKCDSLYYSLIDSTFRFYTEPVIWSNNNQISGNRLTLTTKNKKVHQFIVEENAISISNTGDELFNQLKGDKIIGDFADGEIESIHAIGNSVSIYYLQDDDSAYVGMDYTDASDIIMKFQKRELKKVIWLKGAKGNTFPFNKIPEDKRKFPGFKWLEAIRPKSSGELFGK